MRVVLVIDTCGENGYVAAVDASVAESTDTSVAAKAARWERRLAVRATQEELMPALDAVLREAGVSFGEAAEVAAVAAVRGPGSFTGVRIGLATAKGLCEALEVPLVTLSRLAVLASAAPASGAVWSAGVWAWLRAGRGDVYAARFGGTDSGAAEPPEAGGIEAGAVLSVGEAAALAAGEPVLVCEPELRDAHPEALPVEPAVLEQVLCDAALLAVRTQRWADPALVDALYLRVPDAELLRLARQA